jgi:hypothetical protein
VAELAAADDGGPPARFVAGDFTQRGGVMSDTQEARGRRWHQVRPQPRRRADLMGFNSTWWMALGWLIVILLLVFPFPWVW